MEAQLEEISREIEELTEEHSGEEGLLTDAKNEKGKLTKTSIKNRIKELKYDEIEDEIVFLKDVLRLLEQESTIATKVKFYQQELNKKTVSYYSQLDIDEIKQLVVIEKWFAQISADSATEIERTIKVLVNRLEELEERYAHPMPELTKQVSDYSDRVEKHLKEIGISW